MIIKPVYLVEPEPNRDGHVSRRAMIIGGVSFFAAGGVCGYFGHALVATADSKKQPDGPRKIDLAWARTIARGSESELLRHGTTLVAACSHWPDDHTLLDGLARLARIVVRAVPGPERDVCASALTSYFHRIPPTDPQLRELAHRIERLSR